MDAWKSGTRSIPFLPPLVSPVARLAPARALLPFRAPAAALPAAGAWLVGFSHERLRGPSVKLNNAQPRVRECDSQSKSEVFGAGVVMAAAEPT